MFCHSCGHKLPDGAAFCPECGTKTPGKQGAGLGAPSVNSQSSSFQNGSFDARGAASPGWDPATGGFSGSGTYSPTSSQYAEPSDAGASYASASRDGAAGILKKHGKAIGIIAAVVVAIIVIIVIANYDPTDYIGMAKESAPFDELSMPYTLGEVVGAYVPNAHWSSKKITGGAEVTVSGTPSGTSSTLSVKVNILPEKNSDWYAWEYQSVTVNGQTLSADQEGMDSLYNVFRAYDNDYANLSPYCQAFSTDYMAWTADVWSMAVYEQKMAAAKAVLLDIVDAINPNLRSLMNLASDSQMESAVASVAEAIQSSFQSAGSNATIGDMRNQLLAALGFLALMFGAAAY